MLKRFAFILAIGGLGLLLSTCKKPTLIGEELVEDDRIEIGVRDTLSVQAEPFLRDSILVYNPDVSSQSNPGLSSYSVGWMNDEKMGTFKGSFYAQFRPVVIDIPKTSSPTVDSVVLSLEYDSTGFYGPRQQPQSVEVYRVTEHIDPGIFHYSSEDFATEANPIGLKEDFIADPNKQYVKIDTTEDPPDTSYFPPQLRIPLDQTLGDEIISLDSTILATGDEFIQVLRGLHIRPSKETNSLMGFEMYNSQSALRVYYNEQDSQKVMIFSISQLSAIIARHEHDYSGSEVGEYIENLTTYDSVGYVQSLSGPGMKITLPEFEGSNDVLINQAKLTLRLRPTGDEDNYPPIERLVIAKGFEKGAPDYIQDVLISVQNNVNRFFGGTLETTTVAGEEIQQYDMNISTFYQDVVDGTASREIFITPLPKPSRPNRSVIYGPSHSKYPMTFRVVYTVEN